MMINYVTDYIESYHAQRVKFNIEREQLVEYIKREIEPRIETGEIYFDEVQINKCIKYIDTFYFKLEDFQKFIISFIFLFWSEGNDIVFEQFLIMMGRGGGKNGLISGVTNYLQTPMHGIPKYHISLVANSEDQAKMSFEEIYDTIEINAKLQKMFRWGKKEIKNRTTQSILRYKTSNGNTKDGLRDGAVVFDEIHQYEDHKVTDVYVSGLGKVANPREFYIGTDGFVRDGFIDEMKELAHKVLVGEADFDELFPFICKLNNESEVNDPSNWEMANPMFSLPMSDYAKRLFRKVSKQFKKLEVNPSVANGNVVTYEQNVLGAMYVMELPDDNSWSWYNGFSGVVRKKEEKPSIDGGTNNNIQLGGLQMFIQYPDGKQYVISSTGKNYIETSEQSKIMTQFFGKPKIVGKDINQREIDQVLEALTGGTK